MAKDVVIYRLRVNNNRGVYIVIKLNPDWYFIKNTKHKTETFLLKRYTKDFSWYIFVILDVNVIYRCPFIQAKLSNESNSGKPPA